MDSSRTIGQAVQQLRKRYRLTQSELARRIGLEHGQIVSQIEKGQRQLKASEVTRLGEVLHVSANDLLMGRVPPTGPLVLWRGVEANSNHAEEEGRFLQRCRRYAFLEELGDEPVGPRLPQYPIQLGSARFEDVGDLANEIRRGLDLGALPGSGLRKNLERRWRLKLFADILQEGSGATTRGAFGEALLENAAEPPSRRVFSLAHELFHLLTWESIASREGELSEEENRRNEQLANAFASALLIPEEAVTSWLGQRPVERLVDLLPLATELSVSLPALLWRMVNLQRIDRDRVRQYLESDEPRGFTDAGWSPPKKLNQPLPKRYVALAFAAYVRGKLSIGKLAELLETTVGRLEQRLDAYGLDLDEDAYQTEVLPA
jgi:Zn-dependent peptidase ImmA (M78 family)/transcriptional regulator with XRE-family HTH domain